MGRKRKPVLTRQSWMLHTKSRKQKRRRQTRWNGVRHGNSTNVGLLSKQLSPIERAKDSSNSGPISFNSSSENGHEGKPIHGHDELCRFTLARKRLRNIMAYFGVRSFFSRLVTGAYRLQRLAMSGLKIRNVFVFLDWLRRITGCGLQTLGKLLVETSEPSGTDSNQLKKIISRMENLENEVLRLKTELAKETSCHSCTNQPVPVTGSFALPPAAPLPAPPPPPPPPPILAPPPPPLQCLKNKVGPKAPNSNNHSVGAKHKNLVTLEDLKTVKLRKVTQQVSDQNEKENALSGLQQEGCDVQLPKTSLKKQHIWKEPQCVVTLDDIQNVKLKRSRKDSATEKQRPWTQDEMLVMRRNLKKVDILRSPGGTPLVSDKMCENGNGLTPMMMRALKKKFKHAHPLSPESCVAQKRKRKSVSPLVGSPHTPSPLKMG